MPASQPIIVQDTNVGGKPSRSLGTLPTAAPSGASFAHAKAEAHGVGSPFGLNSVSISGAATITLYVFDEVLKAWVLGGATSARNALTFSAAGMDDFRVPVGMLFYLKSSAGSITAATSAPPVNSIYS